jgi:hypothetical protein
MKCSPSQVHGRALPSHCPQTDVIEGIDIDRTTPIKQDLDLRHFFPDTLFALAKASGQDSLTHIDASNGISRSF